MNKRQYFLEAMQTESYCRKDWVIACFSVVRKMPESASYPYKIVHGKDDDFIYFIDPNNNNELTVIEESNKKTALFKFSDRLVLQPHDMRNVTTEIETNYGNAYANACMFIYAFGDKIPFMTGKLVPNKIEDLIASKLVKGMSKDFPYDANVIYTDEHQKFCDGVSMLGGFTQLCCPAGSKETMTIAPEVIAMRDKLLSECTPEQLRDPAKLAEITNILTTMDRASHKGTSAEGFLINGKSYDVSRMKSFIMVGAEAGMDDNLESINPILTSLKDGFAVESMPQTADSIRAASYSRGKLTALGGESVKYFYRIFQNTRIIEDDCGTKNGLQRAVYESNYKQFTGLYLVGSKDVIDLPTAKGYIGSKILVRSPIACISGAPSFCKLCAGDRMASAPNSVHTSVADVGSTFMLVLMKKMHGKALKTARYNFRERVT